VTYRVQVARTAARQLTEQLLKAVAAACLEFLYGPLAENPHRVGAPLRKPLCRLLVDTAWGISSRVHY
jgi:mRNA interferase RelE/StbE